MGKYEDPRSFMESFLKLQQGDVSTRALGDIISAVDQMIVWTSDHVKACSDQHCGHRTMIQNYYDPLKLFLTTLQGKPEASSPLAVFLGCMVVLLSQSPLEYATRFDQLFSEVSEDSLHILMGRMRHGNA